MRALVYILVAIACAGGALAVTSYTTHTRTVCNGGSCELVVHSNPRYAQNLAGEWVDAGRTVGVSRNGYDLTFHREGPGGTQSIMFETGILSGVQFVPMSTVHTAYPELVFSFPSENRGAHRKYDIIIQNVNSTLAQQTDAIALYYKTHNGFNINDLDTHDARMLISDHFALRFEDALDQGLTVTLDKQNRRVLLGNLSAVYSGGTIHIDPTIEVQPGALANQGYCEDDDTATDVWRNEFSNAVRQGKDGSGAGDVFNGGYVFPTVSIPPGATINQANISLYQRSSLGSVDLNLTVYAEASDNASVYPTSDDACANYQGRSLTVNSTDWDINPLNLGYQVSPDLSDEVQEVINRGGWTNNSNINILTHDDGSADFVFMQASSWDETSEEPTLRIAYTVGGGGGDSCDTCTWDGSEACTVDAPLGCSGANLTCEGSGTIIVNAAVTDYACRVIGAGCTVAISSSGSLESSGGCIV